MDPPAVIKPRWEPIGGPVPTGVVTRLPGLRTDRGKNARSAFWAGTHARNKAERNIARLAIGAWFGGHGTPDCEPPFVATLVRVAPSEGLDDDNLSGALAYLRDGVADALGTGDGPKSPVTWRYEQRRGPWGVEVRIEWGAP